MNWKTTSLGTSALIVSLGHILVALGSGGNIDVGDITAIVTGIGLIFAADAQKA